MSDNLRIGEYLKSNFVRLAEVIVVVTAVFVTMQHNVKVQGDVLERVVKQQEKQSEMSANLAIAIAELAVRVKDIEGDTKELNKDFKQHVRDCRGKE